MELTQNDRDIVDPESAKIRKISEEELDTEEELREVAPTSELDAKELETHETLGGWRKGLLVARNVRDDYGDGDKPWEAEGISKATWYRKRETSAGNASSSLKKLSIRAFSKLSNLDQETISKYLKIWNLAVADGLPIPAPSDLVPGQDVDFLVRDEKDALIFTPDSWKKYTKKPSGKEKDDFLALAKKIKAFLETDLAPLNATNFDEQKELEYSVDKVKEFGESLVTFGNEVIKRCNDSAKDLHHEFVE